MDLSVCVPLLVVRAPLRGALPLDGCGFIVHDVTQVKYNACSSIERLCEDRTICNDVCHAHESTVSTFYAREIDPTALVRTRACTGICRPREGRCIRPVPCDSVVVTLHVAICKKLSAPALVSGTCICE